MKMHMPSLHTPPPIVWWSTFICLLLGGGLALILRGANAENNGIDPTKSTVQTMWREYLQSEATRKKAEERGAELQKRLDEALNEQKTSKVREELRQELQFWAGDTPVSGPGIIVVIDDSGVVKAGSGDASLLITHDFDLLMLVNELHSAGAEAISLNGERIISNTAIRCAGPIIRVNGNPISQPFTIKAIGKPDTLLGALTLPGGEVDSLKPLGIKITINKQDKVDIPGATLPKIQYGKLAPETQKESGGH